jgi:hypothetical protein
MVWSKKILCSNEVMADVREIPSRVFDELTTDRQVNIHGDEVKTCDMDHNLWLRIDTTPGPHVSLLLYRTLWELDESLIATKGDVDGKRHLASLIAGRFNTGSYTHDSSETRASVGLLIAHEDVAFSDPRSAESVIYGLGLVHEMAKRSFILLTTGDYDRATYWSDEINLS